MSNYEELVKAITVAVPEIMELGDYCYVHITNLDGLDRKVLVTNETTMDQIKSNPKIDDYEILGRKIWLDDVLRAANACMQYLAVNQDMGEIMTSDHGITWQYTGVSWTLGVCLDDQPQPTKDFLASILLPQ